MKVLFENWRKHLNEISEEELEDISDVLHDIKPSDLSFNNMFGDKMRLISPLPVKDSDFDALKKVLEASDYEPDF